MENAINEMENRGVQSYILDLRNNPVSPPYFSFNDAQSLELHQFDLSVLTMLQGGLVKAGLDVAQIWLDGTETLVNTIDRNGNLAPIKMIDGHAITRDPLVVLVSLRTLIYWIFTVKSPVSVPYSLSVQDLTVISSTHHYR